MLVSHRIDHDSRIIITTFAPEEVTLELFIEAFSRYQEELRYLPDFQAYNELVDFRPIISINITAAELKEFSAITRLKDQQENITRLALLVDSNSAFTLAKVYEMFRNLNPKSRKKVRVFRDMETAYDWLTESMEALANKSA